MRCRTLIVVLALTVGVPAAAQTGGAVVFDNLPSPVPGNVVSLGYQCCGTSELGDLIQLEADTPRRAGYVTVLMSSWSLHSNYPTLPAAGYTHPITLSLYADSQGARDRSPIASVTQSFTIPWRPEADPTCPGGTAWRADATTCYNGLAFTLTFDLRGQNLDLPDQFIYGVSYNTQSWGYEPLGVPGPYESLNVGFTGVTSPAVGTDPNPDELYWNTVHAAWYSDGGVGGSNIFRPDTGWTGYVVGARFTTFAVPTTTEQCKNGAWVNLVRPDFTPFSNQGSCVAYVNTGS